jgi:hypothetical protein
MSWGTCGDIKRKCCIKLVRNRKSSILARSSPKQHCFAEKKRREGRR